VILSNGQLVKSFNISGFKFVGMIEVINSSLVIRLFNVDLGSIVVGFSVILLLAKGNVELFSSKKGFAHLFISET
jgi:hypothetical protein